MKVVDVCEFYSPQGGGVRTYVHAKLAAAAALGHEAVVIAPGERDEEVRLEDGGRLITVRAPRLPVDPRYFMFWDAAPVHRLLDAERPDVLEASSPWRGAFIAQSWRGQAVRAMFMHHDPLSVWAYSRFDGFARRETVDAWFEWMWRYLRRACEGFEIVVCASPSFTDRLTAGGIAGAVTVPLGVDAGVFSPGLRDMVMRAELLARCGLDPEARLLLGVGRHTPEKRWPCVIDAVAKVAADRPLGLLLVGDGHDRARVLKGVGGNPHILTVAPINDRPLLARLMASCDALVHGSAAETFGLVVAEAIASGLPLVAPAAGGAGDLAAPCIAETYRPGDRRDCAEALARLLDRDPMRLRMATLGAASRAKTMHAHFAELFGLYEEALPARRQAA
jgi:alpha-1,6-mannosyltransferase